MRTAVVALFAAAICSGSQSIQLNGSFTGVYTVPNTGPYNSLGSYYYDFRIHGWSYPASPRAHEVVGAPCKEQAKYRSGRIAFPLPQVTGKAGATPPRFLVLNQHWQVACTDDGALS